MLIETKSSNSNEQIAKWIQDETVTVAQRGTQEFTLPILANVPDSHWAARLMAELDG